MNFPIIQQHDRLIQAVSARELFKYLEIKDRFSVWFERQLQYGFIDNYDYLGCRIYDALARQDLDDYAMTIDMAKQVAMIQKTDKSALVRRYFIDCEQKLKQPVISLPDFTNPAIAARAWADEVEAKQVAQDQLAIAAPKVNAYDKLIDTTNLKTVGDVAKSIGLKSAQQLNAKLDAIGAYDKRCKRREWAGWFVDKGYGEIKTTDDGWTTSKMTAKGQAWALELFGS